MKLKNIDNELIDPMGRPFVFEQRQAEVDGQMVVQTDYLTLRRVLGLICMWQGPEQGEALTIEEKKRQFSITQAILASDNSGDDSIELFAPDIVFLRKAGSSILQGVVYGYLESALDGLEDAPGDGIKMS